jgi:hypothetical protein
MNGFVLLPHFYSTRHTDNYKILFKMLEDELGFKVRYGKASLIPKDVDIVIAYSIPHHQLKGYNLQPLLDLPERVKIIGFPRDLQSYNKKICEERMEAMFNRYDLILSYYYDFFVETYPQYLSKFRYMPQWFASHERYADLVFNESPTMKCLISGTAGKVYPLRTFMGRKAARHPDMEVKATTWGKVRGIVKKKYAQMLHSYYCCATCGSRYKMVLAKHLEIPAVGSLLLCDKTNDLERIGFVPEEHYVPVTQENAVERIEDSKHLKG